MNPKSESDEFQETLYRMRRAIGWVGFTLPLLLLLGVNFTPVNMQDSISEFFFTGLRDLFTMPLAIVGVFLITYHGHKPDAGEILTDYRVSLVAGIAALMVALTPTICTRAPCVPPYNFIGDALPDGLQIALHSGAAGLFFACLAVFCLLLFTKSDTPPENQSADKKRRNTIYRMCGWTIIAMIVLLLVFSKLLPAIGNAWDDSFHFTFIAEAIAVMAFGFSWLLKGETLRGPATTFLYGASKD